MKLSKSVAELQREHVVLELSVLTDVSECLRAATDQRGGLQALCAVIWDIALPPPSKSQR